MQPFPKTSFLKSNEAKFKTFQRVIRQISRLLSGKKQTSIINTYNSKYVKICICT